MDQIITLNKTFEDRLTEYNIVFGTRKLPSISEIKNQWSLYLELELEVSGWQAFWKVPHSICTKNNIPHPTIVLVQINRVNYKELEAIVEVIAVQGDIDLHSNEFNASLIHLWPTKQQSELDAVPIANTLDKLRFFYVNVLMPWDYIQSECDIEERLQFYFNIKESLIAKNKTVKARALLKAIQNDLEHVDRINFTLDQTLVELNTKIYELKLEYELLQIVPQPATQPNNKKWLVFPENRTIKNHLDYLESLKCFGDQKEKYQTAISLESALELALTNDTILINKGRHYINLSGFLKDSIILKSISTDPETTIINTNKKNALIEFMGDKLHIENIFMNISNARCALITHCGQITIKNCIISGHKDAEHAIIALPGSSVSLENCQITGFNVGLYASANSSVNAIKCRFYNISTAMKLFDHTKMSLFQCVFEDITRNCIYLQTKREESRTGDENIFKNSPITINDCKFEDSSRIAVIENKEDIFNNC